MARQSIVSQIREVLNRYFETDSSGNENESYDPDYSAQDAIDDIDDIIGGH